MKFSIEENKMVLEPSFLDDLKTLARFCPKQGDSVTLVRGPELSDDGKFVLESAPLVSAKPKKDALKERPKKEG